MAYNKKLGYDPEKDYSLALNDSGLTAEERSALTAERQNKINDQYGGKEPNYMNTGKTYSSLYNGTDLTQDYNRKARTYAAGGDLNAAYDALFGAANSRDAKIAQTGENYGTPSTEIWNEIVKQYGNKAPTYGGSQYDPMLQQTVGKLTGQTYDEWLQGDTYKRLADRYAKGGQNAMENVLAQMAARTGGLASSYAEQAAQNQYNEYMGRLEDAAYNMYQNDRNDLYNQANLLNGLANNDYNRFADQLGQWNTDRSYQYNLRADQAAQEQQAAQLQRAQDEQRANVLAGYGDFSGFKALGYSDDEVAMMKDAYDKEQAQLAAAAANKGSGTRSSGNGTRSSGTTTGGGKPKLTAAQTLKAIEDGIVNDETMAAYEYWYGQPYDDGAKASAPKSVIGMDSLDYDPDEGIFTWNGTKYNSVEKLQAALNSAAESGAINDATIAKLKRYLNAYGFNA